MDIKTSNKPKYFTNRMIHNGRLKNLSTSSDKEYKNIIFIDNREDYKFKQGIAKSQDKVPTRSEIGKSISRLRDRQKKAKKQATKNKLQLQIDSLIEQRDKTINRSKLPKKSFVEFVFTVTDNQKYRRDTDYAKDFNTVVMDFIKAKFPNFKIVFSSAHLDQHSEHQHLNGYYENDTITNDLKHSFGDGQFQYSQMQKEFNIFVAQHQALKKYNLDITPVVKGGRKDYIKSLPHYKALQQRMKHKAKAYVENFIKWAKNKHKGVLMDKDKIIEELAKKLTVLKQESLENETIPKHFQDMLLENRKLSYKNEVMEEDLKLYEIELTKTEKKINFISQKYTVLKDEKNKLLAVLEQYEQNRLGSNELIGVH